MHPRKTGKAGAVFSEGSRSTRSPCRYSVFDEPTPPLCLSHLDRRKRYAPTDSSSNPTREPDLETLASASSRCQRRPLTISRRVVIASSSDGYDQAASACCSRGGRRRGTDGCHDPGPARSREPRLPDAGPGTPVRSGDGSDMAASWRPGGVGRTKCVALLLQLELVSRSCAAEKEKIAPYGAILVLSRAERGRRGRAWRTDHSSPSGLCPRPRSDTAGSEVVRQRPRFTPDGGATCRTPSMGRT